MNLFKFGRLGTHLAHKFLSQIINESKHKSSIKTKMKTSPAGKPDTGIRYLRFLNNTLQIKELKKDVCDKFTQKIFDYLEDEPLFDAQIFCAFLYYFIFDCKRYGSLVMTAESNLREKMHQAAGSLANELFFSLDSHPLNFTLKPVFSHQFHNTSIEEKLKHLLASNEPSVVAEYESKLYAPEVIENIKKNDPSWKAAPVNIVLPKTRDNTGIVPYYILEFSLPRLSVEQKLDIIHFTICALNYLSQKDEPLKKFANPEFCSLVLGSKPEHLKGVSDNLNRVRDSVILNAVGYEEQDQVEFNPNAPDIIRILKARNQDPKIEKQWLDENSPVFVKADIEVVAEKATKTTSYPPYKKERIIDAAVRLSEKPSEWRIAELIAELQVSSKTYYRYLDFFDLTSAQIRDEAEAIIREKEK